MAEQAQLHDLGSEEWTLRAESVGSQNFLYLGNFEEFTRRTLKIYERVRYSYFNPYRLKVIIKNGIWNTLSLRVIELLEQFVTRTSIETYFDIAKV